MDKEINNSFIDITENIFKKLFNTDIKSREAYTVTSKVHDWDISGVVGVIGDYEGVISIRLKQELASNLLEQSRIDSPEVSARWNLINDMIGEIVNNIAGNVLSKISEKKFIHSVPITVQGENHILQWPKTNSITAIPFEMELGIFELQYSLLKS